MGKHLQVTSLSACVYNSLLRTVMEVLLPMSLFSTRLEEAMKDPGTWLLSFSAHWLGQPQRFLAWWNRRQPRYRQASPNEVDQVCWDVS